MGTERSDGPWKQLLNIEIRVSVIDPAKGVLRQNNPPDSTGFLTSHRVILRTTRVGDGQSFDMLVDDGVKIFLTEKEYSFMRTLVKRMLLDSKDPARGSASMGWVTKTDLITNELHELPLRKSSALSTFAGYELAGGVFDLRNKLEKHNVSRELIESGKKGTHSYRVSTSAKNLSLEPP
jgi:hypothetical protein